MVSDGSSLLTLLRRGVSRRCPVCARGRIFRSLLRLRRTCAGCGWILEREPPAVGLGVPVIGLASLVALPLSRGAWAAIEYYTDLRTGEVERGDYEERAFRR